MVLYCIVLCCAMVLVWRVHDVVLYCIVLYCIVLYCIIHYTVYTMNDLTGRVIVGADSVHEIISLY